jgi:hypothetical protein
MRRAHALIPALILTLGLAACVAPDGEGAALPGAIVGEAIATTALPPPDAAAAGPETVAAEAAVEAAPADDPAADDAVATAEAAAEDVAEDGVENVAEDGGEDPAAAEAPAPRSEAQIACERRGGTWSRVIPGSEARACVFRTRDNGRRCEAGTDCQGECLARSGTCAPVTPLFGCHEILDDTGRRMTQCIE